MTAVELAKVIIKLTTEEYELRALGWTQLADQVAVKAERLKRRFEKACK